MIPEATIQKLLEAAEVAGMPEGLQSLTDGVWSLQVSSFAFPAAIDTALVWDAIAVPLLLEHLRRWLEKRNVFVGAYETSVGVVTYVAEQLHPEGRIRMRDGRFDIENLSGTLDKFSHYEDCIAAAVLAMKDNTDAS